MYARWASQGCTRVPIQQSCFKGRGRIAQKVGEEAVETVIAAMEDKHGELVEETADLIYHLLVLLVECGVSPQEIKEKLAERRR